MKALIYSISILAISIIIFNLTQINFEDFISYKNFISGILILAGLSCLIIMRIMLLNERIKKIRKKN